MLVKSLVNQKDNMQNVKASHRRMVSGRRNPGRAAMHWNGKVKGLLEQSGLGYWSSLNGIMDLRTSHGQQVRSKIDQVSTLA